MQPGDTNKRDYNLRLDHLIEDVEQGNDFLCRSSKSSGRGPHKIRKGNIFKGISGVTFAQFYKFTTSEKMLLGAFLVFSIVFHILFFEGVYFLSKNKVEEMKKLKSEKVALRVKLAEEHQVFRKVILPRHTPDVRKKNMPVKAAKTRMPKFKQLSPQKLALLGQSYMGMAREGTFPALILSYRNPTSYIREMYVLGAKTVVYNTVSREYYEINLLDGGVLPLSNNDFKNFSLIKRVIKDSQWNSQKATAASRLKASPKSLEILLLLPMTIETRWIGHQVNLFRQMNIQVSEVETVEAQFQGAKLKLVRVHLKNGSSRNVNDRG